MIEKVLDDVMVILFLMYAIDLVAEYFEMVPQDIIYIRCRGQSLAADFFQDFKDFPFRRGTDIERDAEVVIHPDKKCFLQSGNVIERRRRMSGT